jgi:hypothetical protein
LPVLSRISRHRDAGVRLRLPAAGLPLGAWMLLALVVDAALVLAGAHGWDSAAWAQRLEQLQRGGYGTPAAAAAPLQVHWLWFCARLLALLQLGTPAAPVLRLLLLAPLLLAHLLLLVLVHRLPYPQPAAGRNWLIALTVLNPAVLLDGPWLGQPGLACGLLLAWALYWLIAGRQPLLVLPLLLPALLLQPQMACLLPVLAPLLWRRSSQPLWAGLLPVLLLAELVLLPYWLAGSATAMLHAAYAGGSGGGSAHNLWDLLGLGQDGGALPLFSPAVLPGEWAWLLTPRSVGASLLVLWSLCLLLSTWRAGEAEPYWRNAALAAMGGYLLLPQPHAGGLVPAAILALPAAVLYPRLAFHAVALTLLAALDLLPELSDGVRSRLLSAAVLAYGAIGLLQVLRPLPSPPRRTGVAAVAAALVLILALLLMPTAPSPEPGPASRAAGGGLDATRIPGRSEMQGWGSLHIGQSVEGHALTAGGKSWASGFGTHAPSIIHLPVPAGAVRFAATVGLDDEASGGRLAFRVFADRQLLWDSGPMVSGQAPRSLDVDVTGRAVLELVVDPLGDNSYDHADWLEPRFVMSAGPAR